MKLIYSFASSVYGTLLIATNDHKICFIAFCNDLHLLEQFRDKYYPNAELVGPQDTSKPFYKNIVAFIEGKLDNLDIPCEVNGTKFQKLVWQELRRIPHGSWVSYTQLAQSIGHPKSIRAVANACAANNIAVLIPCHRVQGKNGNLSGYRWGVNIKQSILTTEKIL